MLCKQRITELYIVLKKQNNNNNLRFRSLQKYDCVANRISVNHHYIAQ